MPRSPSKSEFAEELRKVLLNRGMEVANVVTGLNNGTGTYLYAKHNSGRVVRYTINFPYTKDLPKDLVFEKKITTSKGTEPTGVVSNNPYDYEQTFAECDMVCPHCKEDVSAEAPVFDAGTYNKPICSVCFEELTA